LYIFPVRASLDIDLKDDMLGIYFTRLIENKQSDTFPGKSYTNENKKAKQ